MDNAKYCKGNNGQQIRKFARSGCVQLIKVISVGTFRQLPRLISTALVTPGLSLSPRHKPNNHSNHNDGHLHLSHFYYNCRGFTSRFIVPACYFWILDTSRAGARLQRQFRLVLRHRMSFGGSALFLLHNSLQLVRWGQILVPCHITDFDSQQLRSKFVWSRCRAAIIYLSIPILFPSCQIILFVLRL